MCQSGNFNKVELLNKKRFYGNMIFEGDKIGWNNYYK